MDKPPLEPSLRGFNKPGLPGTASEEAEAPDPDNTPFLGKGALSSPGAASEEAEQPATAGVASEEAKEPATTTKTVVKIRPMPQSHGDVLKPKISSIAEYQNTLGAKSRSFGSVKIFHP